MTKSFKYYNKIDVFFPIVNSHEITYGNFIQVFSCLITVLDFIQIMSNM